MRVSCSNIWWSRALLDEPVSNNFQNTENCSHREKNNNNLSNMQTHVVMAWMYAFRAQLFKASLANELVSGQNVNCSSKYNI